MTTMSEEEAFFVKKEIPRCLSSGAWVETQDDRWVSKAFLVAKPGHKT